MKKMILILFILTLTSTNLLYYQQNTEIKDISNIDSIKEEIDDEPITEIIKVPFDINEINNSNVSNSDKDDMENNTTSNIDVISNNEKVEVKVEPKVEQSQPTQPEQIKTEPTIWESLGISEYDYYHSPMWDWTRVDYSIEKYGSSELAHQACIDAGNNLENIISFSCTTINSYSGAYLGDMLRIKN
ncbi:MAG: hypothetical protein ACI33S_00710 [Bacilli bacterium]